MSKCHPRLAILCSEKTVKRKGKVRFDVSSCHQTFGFSQNGGSLNSWQKRILINIPLSPSKFASYFGIFFPKFLIFFQNFQFFSPKFSIFFQNFQKNSKFSEIFKIFKISKITIDFEYFPNIFRSMRHYQVQLCLN